MQEGNVDAMKVTKFLKMKHKISEAYDTFISKKLESIKVGTIVRTNEKQQPYKEIVVFMIFDLKHPIPYRI